MSSKGRQLDPHIRTLLSRLRWRVRAYVWLEGIALAIIWLGLTFWAGLAIDYLPVLAGASEMPQIARGILLTAIAVVLALILYHWVLRRTIWPLSNRSMAVLLERRFRGFNDGLVTAVELTERPAHAESFNSNMLAHTSDEALASTSGVRLSQVFNYTPLFRSVSGAVVLLLTLVLFYAVNKHAMAIWVNRIYLLQDDKWPRNARIEVIGVELLGAQGASAQVAALPLVGFRERSLKVARGSNLRLKVRADMGAKVVPEVCTVYYRTAEGERGRVHMNRTKRSRGQYQDYSFSGKPLRGILSTVHFDVVGHDFRVRGHTIEVVDSPAVTDVELDCEFPGYMVDESLSLWLPRTVDLTNATQLPKGTKVTICARANKELKRVDLYHPETKETTVLAISGQGPERRRFEYCINDLRDSLTLDVTLYDTDNVVTERPYRIFVAAIPDEKPNVDLRLKGISTAVTPDVVIPVAGTITDDYAVDKTWFDVEVNRKGISTDAPRDQRQSHEFSLEAGGRVEASLDFRDLRTQDEEAELKPKDKLMLAVLAADKYSLGQTPNVGSSDRYQLDVVTPDVLLAMLESREIGLRRRFEQIIEEVRQARDFLQRVHSPVAAQGLEPDDVTDDGQEPGDQRLDEDRAAERAQSLRLLRTQQALQQIRKSAQELLGVATSFIDIRQELINNRVDTEDRKKRLKELIAEPIQLTGEIMFPELEGRLIRLEKILLEDLNAKRYDLQTGKREGTLAVDQANDILVELERILQQMLDLETYNELLDIVRQLIRDQERIVEETKKERKKGLLRDLQ